MFEYKMDHIMSYNATLEVPEIIGEVPEGFRANFYVKGGTISGPKVFGRFRPTGGDWLLKREARHTLRIIADFVEEKHLLQSPGYAP